MILRLLAAAGCVALLASAAQAPRKVFPYSYKQYDFPNGLRLIAVPATDFPNSIAVYIVVGAGSRNEVEPGHTGFAHLFEHLMFKGTEEVPEAKYEDMLKRIGAASNAFTTGDYTCYSTLFSKEDLGAVLMTGADRFQNLKYTEAEFKAGALAVLGEYNKNSSNPYRRLDEVLHATAFDKSTYKHTTLGFLKDIQDMPNQYGYSLKFYGRFYRPEYTTIIVVGDVKPDAARGLVRKYWGAWKRGGYKPEIPVEPPQKGPRTNRVDWPAPTLPVLAVAFKAPAYSASTKDTAALEALASLAFSPESELHRKLVIDDQTVDTLGASMPYRVDPALFEITARVKRAEDVDSVRDRILQTVKEFQEKPVDAARLDVLKAHLRHAMLLEMDSSDAVARVLAEFIALRRTPETMNRLYGQFAALTPADIQAAARKYLVGNSRTIVTLAGPAPAATAGGAR